MFESKPRAPVARHLRKAILAAGVVTASLALAGGLKAQDNGQAPAAKAAPRSVTTTTTAYGGWEVVCSKSSEDKARKCAATYRVVNQQNQANLLVWMFGRNDQDAPLTEVYTFPEILIAPGVVFTLDSGKTVTVQFVSCSGTSCKAGIALDAAKIKLFRQSKSAKVAVTQNDGKVLTFNLDVSGIDQALKDLDF